MHSSVEESLEQKPFCIPITIFSNAVGLFLAMGLKALKSVAKNDHL